MNSNKNLKLSFKERASLGAKIISQQPEISYQGALAQIQRLQEASKVNLSSKKHRKTA